MSNVLHSNSRYVVTLEHAIDKDHTLRYNGFDFYSYYLVVNKETGVAEFAAPQLPEAISAAEQLEVAMDSKPWEWVKASAPKVNPDGSSKEPEVH